MRSQAAPAGSGTWRKKKYHDNPQEKSNSFKTASGELIRNYGPVGVVGYDVGGVKRSINGNATDVRKVLVSAGKLHAKGHCAWMFKVMPLDRPNVQGDGADLREPARNLEETGLAWVQRPNHVLGQPADMRFIGAGARSV